jgi:hypothetical protein
MRSFVLLAISSLALAESPRAPTAESLGEVVVALIKKGNRQVMVDVVDGETSWSDAAILERGKGFPRSITQLIKNPSPDRKVEAGKVAGLFDSYQQHHDGYVAGKVERTGPDCFIVSGAIRALVNCAYVDYLQVRYPKATFFVHGAFEPALLLEKERLHAMLMPMKR